jgi:hypothetical protein
MSPRRSPQTITSVTAGGVSASTPPLQWWRSLDAEVFTAAHVKVLQKATAAIGMIGEPRWSDAVQGDAAAAIGVALRTMKRSDTPPCVVDLHMSLVLCCAIKGDRAAAAVLVMALDKIDGGAAVRTRLRRSWRRVVGSEAPPHPRWYN